MPNKNDTLKKYESYLYNFDLIFKKNVHNNSTSLEKELFRNALKDYIDNIKDLLFELTENNQIEEYNFIRKRISSDFMSRGLSKLEVIID